MGDITISADPTDPARLRLSGDVRRADLHALEATAVGALAASRSGLVLDITGLSGVGAPFVVLLNGLADRAASLGRSVTVEAPAGDLDWLDGAAINRSVRVEPTQVLALASRSAAPPAPVAPSGTGRREGRGYIESYGVGRRCAAPGCQTMLSRYNGDAACFAHATDRRGRG